MKVTLKFTSIRYPNTKLRMISRDRLNSEINERTVALFLLSIWAFKNGENTVLSFMPIPPPNTIIEITPIIPNPAPGIKKPSATNEVQKRTETCFFLVFFNHLAMKNESIISLTRRSALK